MSEFTLRFTVNLGVTTTAALGVYADDVDSAAGDVAAELIREGLLNRGYLVNDNGLVRLPGDAPGAVAKPDPGAAGMDDQTPPFLIPPTE